MRRPPWVIVAGYIVRYPLAGNVLASLQYVLGFEAGAVSATMTDYRDYLRRSRGELSVAKNVYAATRNGWYSTRSAAYLASGRPVVVQDAGFPAYVPTGLGLHAFATAEEAVAGLAAIRAGYPRASRHAREVAEGHFTAERLCAKLLADSGL